jgi:hypothetical protein
MILLCEVQTLLEKIDISKLISNIDRYHEKHKIFRNPSWKLHCELLFIYDQYVECVNMVKSLKLYFDYKISSIEEEKISSYNHLPIFFDIHRIDVEECVWLYSGFYSYVKSEVKKTFKSIINDEEVVLKIGKMNCTIDLLPYISFRTVANKKKVYKQILHYIINFNEVVNSFYNKMLEYTNNDKTAYNGVTFQLANFDRITEATLTEFNRYVTTELNKYIELITKELIDGLQDYINLDDDTKQEPRDLDLDDNLKKYLIEHNLMKI